ncbi:MAG TPA: glutathione S-transferase family protein [Polyangiaceae bacterium]|nr:glutathione S-transferase family protein [Polyangiaceae bacterium]
MTTAAKNQEPARGRLTLIGQYDSPFVRRVGVALVHYGLGYDHWPWSVWADQDQLARFSPLRRVPVLLWEDGSVLLESFAILDALDDRVGAERALLPRSGPERRHGLRVAALATGLADKAVSLLYEHVLRRPEAQSPVWAERCAAQIHETLAVLEGERARSSTTFWLGEALTHADIAVACALRFTREAHPELFEAAIGPALEAHARLCETLPVFHSVVQPLLVQLD